MSVRRLIVEVELAGLDVTEFCRVHGVSTWFFYQLRKRYAAEGEAGLVPRSRAAKTVANRTPEWVEDLVVELRKELDEAGLDAGPATIWTKLGARLPAGKTAPSESTIWRILTRRGFITPEPKKAPKHAHRTFAAERANECWQLDDIEWERADGSAVKIITILDDCTRLCPGLKARGNGQRGGSIRSVRRRGQQMGVAGTVPLRQCQGLQEDPRCCSRRLGCRPPSRTALPPSNPRQGGAVPPDPAEAAQSPAPGEPASKSSKPSSTPSATSTTTRDHTGPSNVEPPPASGSRHPRQDQPTGR